MLMRFLCLLFAVLILRIELSAQTAAIKILPVSQTIGIDSSANVVIKLEDIQQLHAYSIEISYDPLLLKYQSISKMNFFSGWQTFYFPFIDTINGKVRVDEAILGPFSQSGSGEVFKIVFNGLAEGNCALNLASGELRNLENQSITASLSNAVIQVKLVVNVSDNYQEKVLTPEINVYPNPFNSTTTIHFNSGLNDITSLSIYNIKGEEILIHNLVSVQKSGTFTWAGRDSNGYPLPSGIYFIRLEIPNTFLIKKVVLLK